MCPGGGIPRRVLTGRVRWPCRPTGCLVDRKGKLLIPGINEAVAPVTDEELQLYEQIDFDLKEYARDVGADTLLHGSKVGRAPVPGESQCQSSWGAVSLGAGPTGSPMFPSWFPDPPSVRGAG